MAAIKTIQGREILDSRANSTLEVDVVLDDGSFGRASVPSGASTGRYEAYKLEDIPRAIANVDLVSKNLIGQDATQQERIDLLLINTDGSDNKANLGGNVTLAISLAVAEAAAKTQSLPLYEYIHTLAKTSEEMRLPLPMFTLINGGKHADSGLSFQEFSVVPVKRGTFRERLQIGVLLFQGLKAELQQMNQTTALGDEGGFAPRLNSNEEAIEVLLSAVERMKFAPRTDIEIGLDVAASAIPDLKAVTYPLDPLGYFEKLVTDYPIALLEDPLPEDDWGGWADLTQRIGTKVRVIGDDLYTTNRVRLQRGINERAGNTFMVKPDQIGTLTETLQAIALAREASMDVVISHRAGETESTFIADLAVGVGAEYIKAGAPARGERVAKYNQLLRIAERFEQDRGN